MDEFVRKAAGIGLPVIILLIAMASTGLAGAAAITAALAMLGPGGMIGGIVLLGVAGLAAEMLAKFGLEALLIAIYVQRWRNGEARENLCREIWSLPISKTLKVKLSHELLFVEYQANYQQRLQSGISKPTICAEIRQLQISEDIKQRLLGEFCCD